MNRTDATQAALDYAAGLLTAVGILRTVADDDALVAIHALSAADALRRADARSTLVSITDAGAAIAEALRTLASLPDEVFDDDAVAEAVDEAQDALAAARN